MKSAVIPFRAHHAGLIKKNKLTVKAKCFRTYANTVGTPFTITIILV